MCSKPPSTRDTYPVQHRPAPIPWSLALKSKPLQSACAQHLSAHSASLTPVSHVRSYPLMCAPSKQLKLRSPHALESWIGPYAASRRLVALRASAGGESRDLDHTSRCPMLWLGLGFRV